MFVTKSNLNKIIRWSPSKYCEYRKSEIVNRVLDLGEGEEFRCSSGSYSENGHLYGINYTFYRNGEYLIFGDGSDFLVLKYKNLNKEIV